LIDANIFPKLIEILAKDENETRMEAVWAVMYVTQGGTPDQIRYLVELNIIPPLCELLTLLNSEHNEILEKALTSLENILKLGEQNEDSNPYAFLIRECGGLDKIENLARHQNENISQKAALIFESFFNQGQDKEENISVTVSNLFLLFQLKLQASLF
jgi:importin subunit alpha-1